MIKINNKFIIKIFLNAFLIFVFSLFFINKVNAAYLSISPSSTPVSVGNIVSLKININTENVFINNGEAVIQYPTDLLEVVSINKSSSIFNLWVEEPKFSNYTGKINFNGGVSNPGYNGNGLVATITFKAKKEGTASIIFLDGAIRANDGLGTDVLNRKNNGTVVITGVKKEDVPTVPKEIATQKNAIPTKPNIISDTHPNQDTWYKDNTAKFEWKIPSGITSIKALLSKDPNSNPNVSYDNSVSQKTINNILDGTSYFHLRFVNGEGGGPIAHYKINIDSIPPVLNDPVINSLNNINKIKLKAEDITSGIDYYTILIDNNSTIKVRNKEIVDDFYTLPILNEGEHKIIVNVYDKAGNYSQSSLTFEGSSISSPTLFLSSNEITTGESIIISGNTSYPGQEIEVTLESNGKEIKKYRQIIVDDGSFSIITDKIDTIGTITIYGENILGENVKSKPSAKLYLKINEIKAVKVTLAIFYPLIGLILIILSVLLFVFLLYLGWHKFFGLKKKINKKLKETGGEVHKALLLLKEELNDQLISLEKVKEDRNLNKKEEIIFKEIEKNIDHIDDFIDKKIKKLM